MVNFSVFNELSLPFPDDDKIVEKFILFFKLLEEMKKKGLETVRLSKDFKAYDVLDGVNFQQFVGQQKDQDFKRKIISFLINNGVVIIDSPIIKDEETEEQELLNSHDYFFNSQATNGGLACCDVWNTIAVSFNSDTQWDMDFIVLQRQNLSNSGDVVEQGISIMHLSKDTHLVSHDHFFDSLENEIKLGITQQNFWGKKEIFFPNTILFCPEVEKQLSKLDKLIFQQAISLLREVETQRKCITDFQHSGEGKTVHEHNELKKLREFTINGSKIFFEKHIKSLSNGYRIYFLQQGEKIHIGYIGKHLKTKNYK
ncbi:MAG: hypothetical protein KZQ83_17510 [gamma proteobacterium symbiont of Taylorina sp.]|nr:hypothetical protein [gamma proteobacterium symbiont of Taylorina sp.]